MMKTVDLLFVDDSDALTGMWEFVCENAGKKIVTFNSSHDFLRELECFPVDTSIYLDSDLKESIKGEDLAKIVFDKGYKNIYLATGHEKRELEKLPWIKQVVGKNPPV